MFKKFMQLASQCWAKVLSYKRQVNYIDFELKLRFIWLRLAGQASVKHFM